MRNIKETKLRVIDASSISSKELLETLHDSYMERINVLVMDKKNNTFILKCFQGNITEPSQSENYLLTGNIELPQYESIEEEIISIKYSNN
ncbi:MAG: hypothetical protein PHC28_07080 [Flavobacterium sp.]|uniref:hypothetical protein n=1 Tax=Flavobacterium sp. TaxID=239 RepID=UPI002631D392|nr:hypothetical protein [Flavobacterium sp.]MDD5150234.1 hypothetical protein [Flavobacterium sp.]